MNAPSHRYMQLKTQDKWKMNAKSNISDSPTYLNFKEHL